MGRGRGKETAVIGLKPQLFCLAMHAHHAIQALPCVFFAFTELLNFKPKSAAPMLFLDGLRSKAFLPESELPSTLDF